MKRVIHILLICGIVTLLSGCSLLTSKGDKKAEEALAVSDNAPFGVKLLDGWKITPQGELNGDSDLEAVNNDEAMFFLAMMEKKEDLAIDLEEYRDIVVDMNESSYGVPLSEAKATKVGSYDAYVNEFDISSDNLNTHMWLFSVETDNYYGQLFAWTLESQVKNSKGELMDIVNSFREMKN